MAWGFVRNINSVGDKSAGTEIVLNAVSGVAVGQVVIIVIGKDNAGTTEQETSEITNVTDSSSNTYTKIGEYSTGLAANAGAVCSVWYSRIVTEIATSGTFTATFSDSRTASAAVAVELTLTSGSTISTASIQFLKSSAADSMTISGLASKEYLFFRGLAQEIDSGGVLPTTGYTDIDGGFTTGGGAASNMSAKAELIITTATGSTSAPTAATADTANVFFALEEIAANAPLPPLLPRFNGMNTLIRM